MGRLFLVTAVAKVINAWKPPRWRAADHDDGAGGAGGEGAGEAEGADRPS